MMGINGNRIGRLLISFCNNRLKLFIHLKGCTSTAPGGHKPDSPAFGAGKYFHDFLLNTAAHLYAQPGTDTLLLE